MTLILALSLGLRIALLPHRWVNPDEGAHLMDGRLALDGLIPIRDFDARQVLYVYLLAAWQRLFGSELLADRVLPMLLGVGATGLVFALGRSLVGVRGALIATATYAFLPSALIWSLNVHLQAVTLVLTGLGYLALARTLRGDRALGGFALTGLIFGITFYMRETGLVSLVSAALVMVALEWRTPRRLAAQVGALLGGFLVVGVGVVAVFSRYLSVSQLWASALNPLHLPLEALGKILGVNWGGTGEAAPLRDAQQPWHATLRNLRDSGWFGSFLLLAPIAALSGRIIARWRAADRVTVLILTAWLGSLALAYGYWIVAFGFYPQYFTEFLPPLAILFGAAVSSAANVWLPSRAQGIALALFLAALGGAFVVGGRMAVPALAYVVIVALALAAGGLGRAGFRRWWMAVAVFTGGAVIAFALGAVLPSGLDRGLRGLILLLGLLVALVAVAPFRPGRPERLAFAVLLLLGGSALIAYDYAGRKIGLAYNCVWPPEVLDRVSREVKAATEPGDEVLSGGVIWALQAERHPFLDISHPLGFLSGMTPEDRRQISQALANRPPRLIVLDGYTEKTLLRDSVARVQLLSRRYRPLGEVLGGRFPVRLFALRPDVAPAATLTPLRPGVRGASR